MKAFVHAVSHFDRKMVESLIPHPDFRRATLNMRLAYAAASALTRKIPTPVPNTRVGLVVGTSYGELQATYDFFSGLAVENIARPLAFQNSLHHSTLGFVSRMLQFLGPGLTVSRDYFTGEDAIDAGVQLLALECDYVIVIGVDAVVEPLRDLMQARIGTELQLAEGAGALLLSREATDALYEIEVLFGKNQAGQVLKASSHYDSDAVEIVAKSIDENYSGGVLSLRKPDGKVSSIGMRRVGA